MNIITDNISPSGDILLVDDNPENLNLLEHILTGAGYQVRSASDGELALRSIKAELPALILLDIKMPGMDGFEVCRRLKEHKKTRSIPIIFISVLENECDKLKAFQTGGVDYINKPFHPEEVLARVKTHITLHQAQLNLEKIVKDRSMQLEQINLKLQQQIKGHVLTMNALRESEERFRHLITNTPDIVWETDEQYIFVYVSPQIEKIVGYKPEELIGRSSFTYLVPETIDTTRELFQRTIETKKDSFSFEAKWIDRKGQSVILESRVTPVYGSDGSCNGFMGIDRDITDRKIAEQQKEKLQAQLLQAQKMESIGRLAGGVAHDFNNMLGVIIGYTEMALMDIEPSSVLHDQLREILQASQRSAELTRQLLAFARKQPVSPRLIDLNETMSGMLNMLRRLIGEDIELIWLPGHDLWKIFLDPSQLGQILANLVVNSRDAISGIGAITMETGNVTLDNLYSASCPELISGEYVLLTVSDTGCGIKKDIMEHIFEPFFTTKETGCGTGLGLATVYGIVRQNNGFIDVYSETGNGATFKIYLPRHKEENLNKTQKKNGENIPKGKETVLICEDEEFILNLCKNSLTKLGYMVITAKSPKQAVTMVKNHTGKIDLLLTDVVMPEMNGRELMGELQNIRPGIKCIYMSGYTAEIIAHKGVIEEGVNFIQKPFSVYELAQKVREVIDAKKHSR
ncbi:MAG: response regulator [Candidatus Eremiobacterota bacterium]